MLVTEGCLDTLGTDHLCLLFRHRLQQRHTPVDAAAQRSCRTADGTLLLLRTAVRLEIVLDSRQRL